jgi:group I intron endonuclease
MLIYKIVNNADGRVYIGQTSRALESRWNDHLKRLKTGTHENEYLQNSWNKNPTAFSIEILQENITTSQELNEAEARWITSYQSNFREHGYNLTSGGDKKEFTEEVIRKISDGVKQSYVSGKNKRVYVPLSDETKNKIKQSLTGRKLSDETRKKMRESAKARPPVSEDTRKKLSKSSTGKKHSDATRKKMSEQRKGRVFSDEWSAKLRESRKGKTHSEETKLKISNSVKNRLSQRNPTNAITTED